MDPDPSVIIAAPPSVSNARITFVRSLSVPCSRSIRLFDAGAPDARYAAVRIRVTLRPTDLPELLAHREWVGHHAVGEDL